MKKFILFLTLLIVNCSLSTATIRYVSHEGSDTPPYTTWESAADSIQKCIDYCFAGDTIIVANGTYYESLIVDKYLWLIGSSMDSTIIDGTGLDALTINFESDGLISLFKIKGKGENIPNTGCISILHANVDILNCRLINAMDGIGLVWSSSIINECIISNVNEGYATYCDIDTCNPIIKNSIIFISNSNYAALNIGTGSNTAIENTVSGNFNSYYGIGMTFGGSSSNIIRNNIVSGFERNIDGFADDSAIVYNNISSYASVRGYTINSKTDMRNNISAYNQTGVVGSTRTNSDYNLYWQNGTNTTDSLAQHDIVANPMFVNDTIPVYGGTYDYHLQKYSPAIDGGDPNILDVDGTRSDIGAYGGPFGQSYKYLDLAPRSPVNLTAILDSNHLLLTWNKNTEADFKSYRIYRDTTEGFIIDSTNRISEQNDTFFVQILPKEEINLYYKITAVDSQGNESEPSEEVHISITGTINDKKLSINNYRLYQNYPNPFNPSTRIGYRLKERGYVKLMVYDIKGELVEVLVNKVQEAGFYEVEFNGSVHSLQPSVNKQSAVGNLASGIYLYRIEVIGEGRIPRFSDMKKMILLK